MKRFPQTVGRSHTARRRRKKNSSVEQIAKGRERSQIGRIGGMKKRSQLCRAGVFQRFTPQIKKRAFKEEKKRGGGARFSGGDGGKRHRKMERGFMKRQQKRTGTLSHPETQGGGSDYGHGPIYGGGADRKERERRGIQRTPLLAENLHAFMAV